MYRVNAKRFLSLVLGVLSSLSLLAQRGGESTYAFLRLPVSPRIAALGGKLPGYGGEKDLSLSIANPAFAHLRLHNAAEVSGSLFLAGIKYSHASYFYALDSSFTLGAHIRQMWYGSFQRRDEFGMPQGTFRAFEMAVGVHASYQLWKGWSIGATLTPIYSSLERYWSFGLACDIGVGYADAEGLISAGVVAQNLGGSLKTYSGRHEAAPFELLAGAKIRLRNAPLVFVFTLQHLENWNTRFLRENAYTPAITDGRDPSTKPTLWQEISAEALAHPILGIEFHPVRYFFLQVSYNHARRMEMITPDRYLLEGFSYGFGVQIQRFALRFSRSTYHLSGASNHLSIAFYFSGGRDAAMRPYVYQKNVEIQPIQEEDSEEEETEE